MSGDPHDASFPHVQFGFVHCSDFEEVEGGGVEEEEGDEGKDPNEFMDSRHRAELPELRAFVAVVDEKHLA